MGGTPCHCNKKIVEKCRENVENTSTCRVTCRVTCHVCIPFCRQEGRTQRRALPQVFLKVWNNIEKQQFDKKRPFCKHWGMGPLVKGEEPCKIELLFKNATCLFGLQVCNSRTAIKFCACKTTEESYDACLQSCRDSPELKDLACILLTCSHCSCQPGVCHSPSFVTGCTAKWCLWCR